MDRKKNMLCLVGAGLIVGLAVLLLLTFRPRTLQAVTIDRGDCQAVRDHPTAEIEETVERKISDRYQLRRLDRVNGNQPEASFEVAIK